MHLFRVRKKIQSRRDLPRVLHRPVCHGVIKKIPFTDRVCHQRRVSTL